MNSGKVFLGVLAGLAAGAALGVLFAPEKGSVTRKNISNKGEDYLDDIKDKLSDVIDAIADKYTSVKKDVQLMVEKEKDMLMDAKKDLQNEIA